MADMPTYNEGEYQQIARDLLRTRRPGIDLSSGGDWDIWALMLGTTAWLLNQQTSVAARLLEKSSAWGEYLRQYAFELGAGRTVADVGAEALQAKGKVILRSLTGSQTQLAGSVLRHADGTTYTLDADVTTPASATKVLRAGLRSDRRRLFQGHVGGGFVGAAAGEVYRFAPTGELCALRDVENGVTLKRYLFDLYNNLDADPSLQDQFVQQLGAVGSITAQVAGVSGNKDAKDVLTVVSPAGTILAEATILYMASGADAMSQAEVQRAVRELRRERRPIGSLQELRALALTYESADLRECYFVPSAAGIGTYGILPVLRDGQYCGPNFLLDFLAFMHSHVMLDKFVVVPVYEVVDTSITGVAVNVSSIYAPDWSLADPSLQGLSVTASTSQTLTLASVAGIPVGCRVIVSNYGSPYIVQRTVTSLSDLTIGLDAPLPVPASAGTAWVTPGGALGDDIIAAIYAAYEARAPSVADTGSAVRYPVPVVADSTNGILAAISNVQGVMDVDYVGGAAPPLAAPGGVLLPAMTILMSTERA